MRIHLADPSLIPELLDFLQAHGDCAAERTGEHEVEATLVGSYRHDAEWMVLELRVRAWQAAHEGIELELESA